MLIHIFEIFFVIWKYNMNFLYIFLRDLAVCMKTKKIFFLFWRKPGILIPDLYLYSIKIQTNIDQNTVKYFGKITNLNFFLLGPSQPMGRGWTAQAWLGHWTKPVTRINNLKHAWIFHACMDYAKVIENFKNEYFRFGPCLFWQFCNQAPRMSCNWIHWF